MNARSNATLAPVPPAAAQAGSVRVWDLIVRSFHWTVVTGCVVNLAYQHGDWFHRGVGYAVAAAVAIRIVWGFVGRGNARFSAFIPGLSGLLRYLRLLSIRREPRYIGHNPAGAVMILALLGLLSMVSVTGWMMGVDRFFGNEVLEELHETSAMAILSLAIVHVLGAVIEGLRHHENLIKSMVTGRKRAPAGSDINNAPDTD
jgi:cytochrome b